MTRIIILCAMWLASIIVFSICGCAGPKKDNIEFEVIPPSSVFDSAADMTPDAIRMVTWDRNCLYCDQAKAERIPELIGQKFGVPVVVVVNEKANNVPYLEVTYDGETEQMPVYFRGFLYKDEENGAEKRLTYLCGRIAMALQTMSKE